MSDWLSLAVSLTNTRDQSDLTSTFVNEIEASLGVSRAWVMFPSAQGRSLSVTQDGNTFEWKVDDFTHPFAHVLQSASPMLLDPSKLNYWLENDDFVALMSARKRGENVLIMPLPPGVKKVKAILMLTGPSSVLSQLLADKQWQKLCEIYINQSQMVAELGKEHRQISALSSSIAEIRRDEKKREKAYELKSVLIGESSPMQKMRDKVVTAAQSLLNVLVCGDTGTGKELVARAVHELSVRRTKPFVAINCAAIPDTLLESELFGHVKGAFSGADRAKSGLLLDADGGTLFLDEIGDMPLSLQAKLLRVLETRSFRPVGGSQEINVDFRLVAATHVALPARVEQGEFRRDLYYRLNQFPILVPSLVERLEDIPELSRHFIAEYNARSGVNIAGLRYAALDLLNRHAFQGNVRELRNLIEYGCAVTASDEEILPAALNERLNEQPEFNMTGALASNDDVVTDSYIGVDLSNIDNLKNAVQDFEVNVIRSRLTVFDGDRTKAAESLGLPKRTLAHKCLKMEID
ncbi:sigma-54 interaction domain-containing protein [Enterovibrio norvegicus]|uniref:Sigma-54 specific transcriptional regulator n=1 Tax=Enterovibrio norvegicus DSM 15893 TaxID=1121869 RepID=A0A1I5JBZ4_9GAMM|nr:sigma 54-interacting transcriptional regulator [Enterovibrio norvegicus]SFO70262.1 sigma-54 specific transcriptional regulator [Enterovibrio norvegicus DSM 15893]